MSILSIPPAAPCAMPCPAAVEPLLLIVDTATTTALAEETNLSLNMLIEFIAVVKEDTAYLDTLLPRDRGNPMSQATTQRWERIRADFKTLDDQSHSELFRFADNWAACYQTFLERKSHGYFIVVFRFHVGSFEAREQLRVFLDDHAELRTFGNEPFVYTTTEHEAARAYYKCLELHKSVEQFYGGY